ncbi:Cell wall alpha-1-3-glucan synthase mok13 [Venturia nashicola]|uniref:Cell wall alpha-1-3-glucan synthase mok13 n=1 Tax=Venturia nashicola TaxID=86259 RepID=A0A4Z1PIE5_9PEZI|nr:Cell wall alpha-1-3-glucan synthase mok13 [Venturia nashicola]TLD35810.1 Cell wall alpha-1-3-glucan synthase mok13 [Venturia nashicola]
MSVPTVRIAFGNEANVLSFASFPADRLMAYSNTGGVKLVQNDNGSSSGSEPSETNGPVTIFFDTCEGVGPVLLGMKTVLQWIDHHPLHGYPATYKGHKQLTEQLTGQLAGGPIPFLGLLRIHESLLLLDTKHHLGGQFVIRNAIFRHVNSRILTPNELFKIGMIFSHTSTLDLKLIDYAVNKTMDLMDAKLAEGTLSQAGFDALRVACRAVPVLDDKMTAAVQGKKDRLDREAKKAAQAAERQAKRATESMQRGSSRSATRTKEVRNVDCLEELAVADQGIRHISDTTAGKLMGGPVVIITKQMKTKKVKGRGKMMKAN